MKKLNAVILSITLLISVCGFAVQALQMDINPACVYTFENSMEWDNVYEYAYDSYGVPLLGDWPGTLLTDKSYYYGREKYILITPEGVGGIILNNGSGSQTEEINDLSYMNYWLDGSLNESGHYLVTYYTDPDSPVIDDTTRPVVPVVYDKQFLLANSYNWDKAYIYAWDEKGYELFESWPGTPIEEKVTKQFCSNDGVNCFVCNIPSTAAGVIINNGSGSQTADITDFAENNFYWLDGSKDDLDHYNALGMNVGEEVFETGDVNCDGTVDVLDATQIQKYSVEKVKLDAVRINVGDVNNDGRTDVLDAADIQKYTVEKISEF